jgi:PAS domain S-box-containing protein
MTRAMERDALAGYEEEARVLFGPRGAGERGLILSFSLEGAINWASDPLLDLLGHRGADLDGSAIDWDEMTPPEYWALDDRCIGQLEQRDAADPYVKEFVRKDGKRIAVRVHVARSRRFPKQIITLVTELIERWPPDR